MPGDKDSFLATVEYEAQTRDMGHRKITRVRAGDGTGFIDLQWWNQAWRAKQFPVGTQVFAFGKIGEFNGVLQVDSPEFEIVSEGDGSQVGRIVPVYPLSDGLFQSNMRRAIADALDKYGRDFGRDDSARHPRKVRLNGDGTGFARGSFSRIRRRRANARAIVWSSRNCFCCRSPSRRKNAPRTSTEAGNRVDRR